MHRNPAARGEHATSRSTRSRSPGRSGARRCTGSAGGRGCAAGGACGNAGGEAAVHQGYDVRALDIAELERLGYQRCDVARSRQFVRSVLIALLQHRPITEEDDIVAHPHPRIDLGHDDLQRLIIRNVVEVCGNRSPAQRRIYQHVLAGNVGQGSQHHGGIGAEEVDGNSLPLLPSLDQLVGVVGRDRLDFDGQLVVGQMRLMKPAATSGNVKAGQVA